MEKNTLNYKSYHGRVIETIIKLPENRELCFNTMKRHSGLCSTVVSVHRRISKEVTEFSPFEDFSQHLIIEKLRCTEKNMINQHERAIAEFEQYDAYKDFVKNVK